jgi:hypothetical protein
LWATSFVCKRISPIFYLVIPSLIDMRRDRNLYHFSFAGMSRTARPVVRTAQFKSRLLSLTKYEELEYVYMTEGRCSSHRSRGKMSSILVRNTKYGVEQRFFLFNPRLLIRYR